MDPLGPPAYDYANHMVGLNSFLMAFEDSEVQTPTAKDTMGVDSPVVRLSPKNAPLAKALYSLSPQSFNKTIDSIMNEDVPYLTQVQTQQISSKPSKPIAPDYNKQSKDTFLHLANVVHFEKFANDTQALCPGPVSRCQIEMLWHKTLRTYYAHWKDPSLSEGVRKKVLAKANSQTQGYQGFDAKAYWELQAVVQRMEGMSVEEQGEIKVKNGHFKAMELARRKKKELLRGKVEAERNNPTAGSRDSLRDTGGMED